MLALAGNPHGEWEVAGGVIVLFPTLSTQLTLKGGVSAHTAVVVYFGAVARADFVVLVSRLGAEGRRCCVEEVVVDDCRLNLG